jgi:hypothetical protein
MCSVWWDQAVVQGVWHDERTSRPHGPRQPARSHLPLRAPL